MPPRAVWAFFEAPPGNSLRTAWRRLALGVATVVQGPFVSSKVMTRSGRRRGVSFDSLGGEMCGPLAREEPARAAVRWAVLGVFPKKWRRSLCREFVDVSES